VFHATRGSRAPGGARSCQAGLLSAALALCALTSCAYWNTYYLAQKNYNKATLGEPYLVSPAPGDGGQYFNESVKYSKKLLSQYPRSKYVDDAYLLWARSLIGRQDPIEAANMLNSFPTLYPKSKLKSEATFYLGVANRQAHKPTEALRSLDEFLTTKPKSSLVPYALLERARALASLQRGSDAADAATALIDRFPKSPLVREARRARASAQFDAGDFEHARQDYRDLGTDAPNDDERFDMLLREADCLEGAREYDKEIDLLQSALAHVPQPVAPPEPVGAGSGTPLPAGSAPVAAPSGPGADRWGRLQLRIGTAHLMAERLDPALKAYRDVMTTYPRTVLSAEAQYRIGYAYETLAENLPRAREEYSKMKDQPSLGGFSQLATTRMGNIDRVTSLGKSAGRDTLERKAQTAFMLAELYLFQHGKPDRALEEYRKIERDFDGTPWGGKAINAQAWLLSRKMNRKQEADSLFWRVIHEYRATEAQLAARDYLEAEGFTVPDSLIERPTVLVDTARAVVDTVKAPPAPAVAGTGFPGGMAPGDSLGRFGPRGPRGYPGMPGDSLRYGYPHNSRAHHPDTLSHPVPPPPVPPGGSAPGDSAQGKP
jgi:tetratricopeptide (TPR) repeat protein